MVKPISILKAICILSTALWIGQSSYGKSLFTIPVDEDGVHYKKGETDIAWGPSAFTIAQDGSFWIADTIGNFLLHYDNTGNMLNKINLDELDDPVVGVGDLEVMPSGIFILDIAAAIPKIIHLSFNGSVITSYEIPQNLGLENGLSGIAIGENGELLIELENGAQVYQLVDQNGDISQVLLNGYTHNGRLYSVPKSNDSKSKFITVGNTTVKVEFTNKLGGLHLNKVNSDGSFYITMEEVVSDPEIQVDQTIRYYSDAGKLLSQTRVPIKKDCTYIAHNIAIGPDKAVYTMTTRSDGVKIQRLRFSKSIKPILPTTLMNEENIQNETNRVEKTVTRSYITRNSIISNAGAYTANSKYLSYTNINGSCAGRSKPRYLKIGYSNSVAYDWGGWDSVSAYNSYMDSGSSAGDINKSVEECSRGVDCSGFVTRAWGISSQKYSTSTLPDISKKLSSTSELKEGDILNTSDSHTVLFHSFASNGIYDYESTTDSRVDRVVYRFSSWTRLYKVASTPLRYNSVE